MATTDETTQTTPAAPAKKKAAAPRAPRAKKPKEAVVEKDETQTAAAASEEVEVTSSTEEEMPLPKTGAYISALGRRKTAIARVRLIKNGTGKIVINGVAMEKFFTTFELKGIVTDALRTVSQDTAMDVSAFVQGGGNHGQAEAVRLGIARALIELNPTYRKTLKKLGFLTRDPRAKERKKPGLKRARRAPQWSKR